MKETVSRYTCGSGRIGAVQYCDGCSISLSGVVDIPMDRRLQTWSAQGSAFGGKGDIKNKQNGALQWSALCQQRTFSNPNNFNVHITDNIFNRI